MTGYGGGMSGRNWRTAGIVILSTGFNSALIALFALSDGPRQFRGRESAPTILLQIEPRPRFTGEQVRTPASPDAATDPAAPATLRSVTDQNEPITPTDVHAPQRASSPIVETSSNAPTIDDQWRVTPRAAESHAFNPASCSQPQLLAPELRSECEARRARYMIETRAITGTGNPDRDAAFARQGAQRLADWEAQRATPSRGDPPCERPNPVAGCEGVNIQVELFSSQDGFLPNLRKRRE